MIGKCAERINVAADAGGLAADLLRRGVFHGQAATSDFGRLGGRRCVMIAIFQQACHAEVEQLHMAPRRNQHVRWFQIAMHHQLRMRIRHGLTNFAN